MPVVAHPISKGIKKKVTNKSAMVKCMSKRFTRSLVCLYLLINVYNTMELATELITNRVPYPAIERRGKHFF